MDITTKIPIFGLLKAPNSWVGIKDQPTKLKKKVKTGAKKKRK